MCERDTFINVHIGKYSGGISMKYYIYGLDKWYNMGYHGILYVDIYIYKSWYILPTTLMNGDSTNFHQVKDNNMAEFRLKLNLYPHHDYSIHNRSNVWLNPLACLPKSPASRQKFFLGGLSEIDHESPLKFIKSI